MATIEKQLQELKTGEIGDEHVASLGMREELALHIAAIVEAKKYVGTVRKAQLDEWPEVVEKARSLHANMASVGSALTAMREITVQRAAVVGKIALKTKNASRHNVLAAVGSKIMFCAKTPHGDPEQL